MNKRLKKKQYPSSCNKCSYLKVTENLITHNGCGKCPNRESLENGSYKNEKFSDTEYEIRKIRI